MTGNVYFNLRICGHVCMYVQRDAVSEGEAQRRSGPTRAPQHNFSQPP